MVGYIPSVAVQELQLIKLQAQTPEQRRRNAKFAKLQENKMGKSEDQLQQKAAKLVQNKKSPISPIWMSKFIPIPIPLK